jgi:AmiR/NasT family two-component response regulator
LRPIAVLVVDRAAVGRERVCRAGRQAAAGSQWIEAADVETASRLLSCSEIDLVVADSHSIRNSLRPWTDGAAAADGRPAPPIVVLGDEAPEGMQWLLDAGAECCLPKRLPQRILERELRQLVAQIRRKVFAS